MPAGKGIARDLASGVSRKLTPYEVGRGYIYLSHGRDLRNLAEVNEVEIGGEVFVGRRIDAHGAVHVPLAVLRRIGQRKVRISLAGTRIRIELLDDEQHGL
ncbi:MAG: hypothetical protein NTU41_10535 [Chloroflexi bacterium]|nr:hypothetical protein [Chloroflexota bacterium]